MDEIPEDIMEIAFSITASAWQMKHPEIAERVARAILAERQRCADVAKKYLEDIVGCDMNENEPKLIAAAILNQ